LISAIVGALTVIGSAAMPWTNVKGKRKEVDAVEEGKKVEDTDKESVKDVIPDVEKADATNNVQKTV